MLAAIRQWVIKTMTKGQTGVVTIMPKQEIIEINVQITAERIMRNGINPNDLKTVGQVENVVEQIDTPKVISADSAEGRGITEQFLGKKKADVLDMEGNKIDTSKGIMGGKQIQPINMTVEERTGGLLKGKYESDAAIKARLVADNKKGIVGIKISLVDDSIAKIKSMEPMDAMKEANLVAGKKGVYKNLDDNQVKKIMDDTQDHIFERDIPEDPEDFATGGRVGLKGGTFLNFIKKFKIKQSGDDVKEFLSKRKFMKDIVGNTEKAKKARELREMKKNVDNYMKQYKGYQFPSDEQIKIDLEKKIQPILNKGRKLNADGGRIGYAGGSYSAKGGYQGKGDPTTGANVGTPESNRGTISGGDGGGNNKPPRVVTRTVTEPTVKDKIRKVGNTIGDISYFKNLINLNPYGIAKNIGGKILMDEILGDQSSLDTEEEYDFSKIKNQTAKVFGKEDLLNIGAIEPGNVYGFNLTDQGKSLEDFRKNAVSMNNPEGVFKEYKGLGAEFQLNKLLENKNTNATENEAFIRDALDQGFLADESDFINQKPLKKAFADGGRIGYKAGSVDKMRRLFLKAIGAGAGTIGAAKSGIFSGFGKGAGKTVAKEVAQQTTSSMPPPYFFKLAEKIKNMGNDVTATTDRTISKSLKSKDGKSEYLLEQDVSTGDTIIKKINKEGDEMITDVEIMELKKGEVVMGKKW